MLLNEVSQKITNLCNTDTNEYTNANRLIDINNAQDAIEAIILRSQDGWKFDDSNQGTDPILTINTVAGTQAYAYNASVLRIIKLEVSSDGTTYTTATSLDPRDLPDLSTTALYTASNPAYTVIGSKIYLYPTPVGSVTAGIKMTVGRLATAFTVTNLTTTVASSMVSPGFDRIFHPMISLYCAKEWAMAKGLSNLNALKGEWNEMVAQIRDFYANKVNDRNIRITGKKTNFR